MRLLLLLFPTRQSGISLAPAQIDCAEQKRGLSSANFVVIVTVANKCVDTHVLPEHCKQCHILKIRQGTQIYSNWKGSQVFSVNHTASSGAMEAAGTVEMLRRSIERSNLVYHEYLGNSDTASFKCAVDSKPYEEQNFTLAKLECVSHVLKRLGTHL